MSWYYEVSPEEVEEYIHKTALKIHEFGMETPAILFLESSKPLAYIGGQMSRFLVEPYLPILGENYAGAGEKMIRIFEKRENVEKLIKLLEDISKGEYEKPAFIKKEEREKEREKKEEKKGWRRYLRF